MQEVPEHIRVLGLTQRADPAAMRMFRLVYKPPDHRNRRGVAEQNSIKKIRSC